MAVKVYSVTKGFVTYGNYEGYVCTRIKLGNGIGYKVETLMNKIIDFGMKLISIEGDFTTNAEIFTVINQLNSAGYKIIFNTDSGDDIGPMVRFKNVILSIQINIPKEGKDINYIPNILSYLREKDEARFVIKDVNDYKDFINFEKTKNISLPKIILEVDKNFNTFESHLFSDTTVKLKNLIIKYINNEQSN